MYNPTKQLFTSKITHLNRETLIGYRKKNILSINHRLEEFRSIRESASQRIFYELCYCVLTPQSSGLMCDRVVSELVDKGILHNPVENRAELEEMLKRTRFWRKKTKYIIRAWKKFAADGFYDFRSDLKDGVSAQCDQRDYRDHLRKEMRGMGIGLKEASHFLRNIGVCNGLAIVDRHIIQCLKDLEVIDGDSKESYDSLKGYRRIEELMTDFSNSTSIPLEELDLLLWSAKTGYIFK